MCVKRWWKDLVSRRKLKKAVGEVLEKRPLREFVYLDEVSLRSLLVSQKDTILEEVSRAISSAEEAELAGKFSGEMAAVAKAEASARYQTSNSSTVQTSRKAVVQTLFKEFRDDENLDYALVVQSEVPKKMKSVDGISGEGVFGSAVPAANFKRGSLVEIEVILEVDPVFKMGTLFTEILSMAEEYPAMLGQVDGGDKNFVNEAKPINKVLQRLLAGLIPIRSKALNYSVVNIEGIDYVVHNEAVSGMSIEKRPLEVVGVTEHLGYWKDIRRVLFSSGKFTILCRVSRDGLQRTWTPVKLADLFGDIAPALVGQIDAASRFGVDGVTLPSKGRDSENLLTQALAVYREKLVVASGNDSGADFNIDTILEQARSATLDVAVQRKMFRLVRDAFEEYSGSPIADEEDLRLRQQARDQVGLSLFPALESDVASKPTSKKSAGSSAEGRLLDVEVVAIYW